MKLLLVGDNTNEGVGFSHLLVFSVTSNLASSCHTYYCDRTPSIFFTATILNWQSLLLGNEYKEIVLKSLRFLVFEKRIKLYAFVIMPNHIHLLWQIQLGYDKAKVQQNFLKYTAQQFKFKLLDANDNSLLNYRVNASDRAYQFWERNALSTEIWDERVFEQKLDYIHLNPLQEKWKLATCSEQYLFSSASFYETGIDEWQMLTHYKE